jgi:hypothetical protein
MSRSGCIIFNELFMHTSSLLSPSEHVEGLGIETENHLRLPILSYCHIVILSYCHIVILYI